jgi:hypothetical protein
MQLPPPQPGRECGNCVACCHELGIDDPKLHKPEGVACPHLATGLEGGHCGIYADRPHTCSTWYCGWRLMPLSDDLRPDRSGILLVPEIGATPGYEKGGMRIVTRKGDRSLIENEELLRFMAKCVAAGVPIWLSQGDNRFAKSFLINEPCKNAVAAGDRRAFVTILTDALAEMARQVRLEMAVAERTKAI